MRFNKKYKGGLFLLSLLLLLTTSISLITFEPKKNFFNENSVILSAPEDPYEFNDNPENATDIRFLEANWLNSYLGNGTLWNDDWYLISLDPGEERLRVILVFEHSAGNIDIEVYNWNYNYINGNYSMDNDEFLEFDSYPSGDYYIRIFGDYAGNTYDLWWEDLTPIDDPFEENDDFYNAAWVDPNWYPNLKVHEYDEDWFRIYLNPGQTIEVSIYFNHDDGNLDLELYDPDYNYTTGSYYSSSSNYEERIVFTVYMPGEWRIRIFRVSGFIDVHYDLNIWLQEEDDRMEENDDYWSARWVDAKYYSDLRIKEYDEDWFRTYLNSDDTIEIRIYFNNDDGNLQLELYDPNDPNSPRDESYNDWNDENIFFTADMSGDWRFRVYRVSGDSNIVVHYNMEIWINGIMEGDDPYEPNNHPEDAYDLRDYERNWLSGIHGLAVQGDEDWYLIDVTPGFQHLIVNLTFDPNQGYINIELYKMFEEYNIDWNSVYSNYSLTGENRAVINYHNIDPGMYVLQVRGDFTGVEYNMWWDDERTDKRPDDNYEENDDIMTAYDLSNYEHQGLWTISGLAIQNDTDWYKIQVRPGFEQLYVLVIYDYQEGAIGLEIYNWASSKVTSNFTMRDNDYINYKLSSNGTYYIKIFGDYSANIYNLRWDTREPSTGGMIPGYDIFILLVAIMGVVVIFTFNRKRSKNHQ